MLEMFLPAGTSEIEHSHPHEMVYFISGGQVRIHVPEGDSVELEIPAGHAMKHEPWTHRVENIRDTDPPGHPVGAQIALATRLFAPARWGRTLHQGGRDVSMASKGRAREPARVA